MEFSRRSQPVAAGFPFTILVSQLQALASKYDTAARFFRFGSRSSCASIYLGTWSVCVKRGHAPPGNI